jgi:Holliday junction resolvase RusA-like endonuclease
MQGEAISFTIPGEPAAFARMRVDPRRLGMGKKAHFIPAKQGNFMGVVQSYAQRAMEGRPPLEGPIKLQCRVTYLQPASWSKKKKAATVWKTSKPDVDNITKLLKDSLNKIAFHDDAQVADLSIQKCYGPISQTVVTIMQIGGDE